MKQDKVDPLLIYMHSETKDKLSVQMLVMAYRIFKRATCIKDLNDFEKVVQLTSEGKDFRPYIELIGKFGFDALLDSIKICVCFENYFKAILIQSGHLIHNIKRTEQNKSIVKQQKNHPVKVNELLASHGNSIVDISWLKDNVSETTISMSILLSPSYSQLYSGIDKDLIKYLEELNQNRNSLHFYLNENFSTSKKILNNLKRLNEIVVCDLAIRQNLIVDKYNFIHNIKLKVECRNNIES